MTETWAAGTGGGTVTAPRAARRGEGGAGAAALTASAERGRPRPFPPLSPGRRDPHRRAAPPWCRPRRLGTVPGPGRVGSGRACGDRRPSGRSEVRRAVGVPAARMDAALKRSRSEEPAELPPSARDLEEEEEEGMEQGLEEEEEVDPRIQVGRAGGAAVVGIYTWRWPRSPRCLRSGGMVAT